LIALRDPSLLPASVEIPDEAGQYLRDERFIGAIPAILLGVESFCMPVNSSSRCSGVMGWIISRRRARTLGEGKSVASDGGPELDTR
jgi:hypothetical protein